jgi:hypothetical protein
LIRQEEGECKEGHVINNGIAIEAIDGVPFLPLMPMVMPFLDNSTQRMFCAFSLSATRNLGGVDNDDNAQRAMTDRDTLS